MVLNIFLFLLLFFSSLHAIDQKQIIVIIPSYNNIQWYQKNLDSVIEQKYDNWYAIYIDDCSLDGTGDAVYRYVEEKKLKHRFVVIKNKERHGALYNLYMAIHACPDRAIIITVDGDDWLASTEVFSRINEAYTQDDIWMTYGTYLVYPDNKIAAWRAIPECIIKTNSYRQEHWYSSHLRTFYAKLFKLVQKEDLKIDGQFFSVTWDMAFMFPMLEMAGEHAKHMKDILYVYNQSNPINDYKVRLEQVLKADRFIRSKERYTLLKQLWA